MPVLSSGHRAFGDAIRALRKERGLTQEALADLCGLTTNYVGDAERGERNVSIRALWQLADGFGIPASELLREAEKHGADKRSGG
jgi:transcriptional regulator with XRE-family HTH domain